MAQGDKWRLPDGREAIELDRTRFLLRVLPLHPSCWQPPPEQVWRAACTKLGSRYHGGAIPLEPDMTTHG